MGGRGHLGLAHSLGSEKRSGQYLCFKFGVGLGYSQFQQITVTAKVSAFLAISFLLCSLGFHSIPGETC